MVSMIAEQEWMVWRRIICQCKLQLCCFVEQMRKFLLQHGVEHSEGAKLNNSTTKVGSVGRTDSSAFEFVLTSFAIIFIVRFCCRTLGSKARTYYYLPKRSTAIEEIRRKSKQHKLLRWEQVRQGYEVLNGDGRNQDGNCLWITLRGKMN